MKKFLESKIAEMGLKDSPFRLYAKCLDGKSHDVTYYFTLLRRTPYTDMIHGVERRVFLNCLLCARKNRNCINSDDYPNTVSPWHCATCDAKWKRDKPKNILTFEPQSLDWILMGQSIVSYGDESDHDGARIKIVSDSNGKRYNFTPHFKYLSGSDYYDIPGGKKSFHLCLSCGSDRFGGKPVTTKMIREMDMFHCAPCSIRWSNVRPQGPLVFEFIRPEEKTDVVIRGSERVQEEEDKGMCSICMDQRSDVLYVDCSHLCICHACEDTYRGKPCPVCRKQGATKRVYIS